MDRIAPLRHLANPSLRRVERLLLAEQWEAAVGLLNRRGRFRDAPLHLKPLIRLAYEYVCRQQSWADFQKAPREVSEPCDRRLVKAWNEPLFAGFPPAEQERPRVDAARSRLAALRRIGQLAGGSSGEISVVVETAVAGAASVLPEGYWHAQERRVALARERLAALARLTAAIAQPASEAAIVTAWEQLTALGCGGLVEPASRDRIAKAQDRLPLLQALRQIPPDLAPDQLDRRLLEIWDEDLLADCAEVEPWQDAYRRAKQRDALVRRMAEAVARRDDAEMGRMIDQPCLAGYPLPAVWMPAIEGARRRQAESEALLAALEQGDRGALVAHFDARLIRQHRDRFARHEARLCRWIGSDVVALECLGLGPAVGRASLVWVPGAGGAYRLRWTWPPQRFSDECVLEVCRETLGLESGPGQPAALYRARITRSGWESGGGSLLVYVEPSWRGAYFVVWATIDVGFRVFASQPLVLGQIERAGPARPRTSWPWGLRSSRRGASPPAPVHAKEVPTRGQNEGDRG
jgi:hypothetical protein